jgi:hypothetical protein
MYDDVPLICDPLPGPRLPINLPLWQGDAPTAKLDMSRPFYCGPGRDPVAVLDGFQLYTPRQWPDAEFCAA